MGNALEVSDNEIDAVCKEIENTYGFSVNDRDVKSVLEIALRSYGADAARYRYLKNETQFRTWSDMDAQIDAAIKESRRGQ